MLKPFLSLALFAATALSAQAAPSPLFEGETLGGWEGETSQVWKAAGGVILGATLEENPRNGLITTCKSNKNFVLRLEYKRSGNEGFVNGGVQFRSIE